MKKISLILSLLFAVTLSSQSQSDFYVTTYANPGMIMERSESTIFANAVGADGEVSFEWSPSDNMEDPYSPMTNVKPKKTTTYIVTATCGDMVATASVTVKVVEVPKNVSATVNDDNVYVEWDEVELADSYIVLRDGIPVSTYVAQTYYLDENLNDGRYCYTVRSERSGKDTPDSKMVCADVDVSDIDMVMMKEMEVYPNPANDVINIKAHRFKSFSIYDMAGQKIMGEDVASEEVSVDISDMDTGMYMLQIVTEYGIDIRKINVVK